MGITKGWPQDDETLARLDIEYAHGYRAGWNAALTVGADSPGEIREDRIIPALKILLRRKS